MAPLLQIPTGAVRRCFILTPKADLKISPWPLALSPLGSLLLLSTCSLATDQLHMASIKQVFLSLPQPPLKALSFHLPPPKRGIVIPVGCAEIHPQRELPHLLANTPMFSVSQQRARSSVWLVSQARTQSHHRCVSFSHFPHPMHQEILSAPRQVFQNPCLSIAMLPSWLSHHHLWLVFLLQPRSRQPPLNAAARVSHPLLKMLQSTLFSQSKNQVLPVALRPHTCGLCDYPTPHSPLPTTLSSLPMWPNNLTQACPRPREFTLAVSLA